MKKSIKCLLLGTYLWNICLRYPNINGPHDADGYSVMWFMGIINELGVNNLLLSPFSYFGMHPYSQPFGTHHFGVAAVQLTGLSIDIYVYVISLVYGIFALNGVFLLTRRISGNNETAVYSLFFLTTSAYFTNYTYWSMSVRAPFMAIMPIFCDTLLRLNTKYKVYNYNYIFLTISIFLLLVTTHRMYTLMFFTVVVPFLIFMLLNIYDNNPRIKSLYSSKKFHYFTLVCVFSILMIAILAPSLLSTILGLPLNHYWIKDKFQVPLISPLLNVIYTYITGNIFTVFVFIGIFKIFKSRYISFYSRFLMLSILASSLFVTNYEYFYPVFLTLFSVIGSIGIKYSSDYLNTVKLFRKATKVGFVFVIVLFLLLLPYSYYTKELSTNIRAERIQSADVAGYGLHAESYNHAAWQIHFVEEEAYIIDIGATDQINWMSLNKRVGDYDLIANDPKFGEIIEIERQGLIDTIFHIGKSTGGSYQYGGSVKDWSGGEDKKIPTDYHYYIMLYDTDSFLYDIYSPKYALELNNEPLGKASYDYPLSKELNENCYVLSSNELWQLYLLS